MSTDLHIYKWIQPSSRGKRITFHVINHQHPKSNALMIYVPPPSSKRKPIYTTAGLAGDYSMEGPACSSWLDLLICAGATKTTIYHKYNGIQESEDYYALNHYEF